MTSLTGRAAAGGTRRPEEVEVAIVGAGFAGLGMGIRLKRAGRDDFVILERGDDVGGTWRDNVYPGVACDIPSHLYSYSFRPKPDWSRVFAPGAEIRDYLAEASREEGLTWHLRLRTALAGARWDEAASRWELTTSHGTVHARSLVMAAGRLSEPRLPRVPGLHAFPGRSFHSARWDATPLAGLRVGVVGTGASAIQLVPRIATEAAGVVVFQRTPAWVLPREDHAYTAAEREAFSTDPAAERALRTAIFEEAERLFQARVAGSPQVDALRERALRHLEEQVADPALRALLTPDYEIGCKRAVFSDDYFPALQRPNVTLEPSALAAIDGSTAVAANGARHGLDVLVFATGFETAHPPFARLVTGRGETLEQHWADGMTSYASTVVHGFPNLFVIDGPNASLGHNSAIEIIEAQLDYVLGALDELERHPDVALDVAAEAEADYTAEIDRLAERTVWTQGGCLSWYLDEGSRRLTLLWPGPATEFRERNAVFDPAPFLPATVAVG